jgi:uncharacterized oligopeptide transporter (OPT) family protein
LVASLVALRMVVDSAGTVDCNHFGCEHVEQSAGCLVACSVDIGGIVAAVAGYVASSVVGSSVPVRAIGLVIAASVGFEATESAVAGQIVRRSYTLELAVAAKSVPAPTLASTPYFSA